MFYQSPQPPTVAIVSQNPSITTGNDTINDSEINSSSTISAVPSEFSSLRIKNPVVEKLLAAKQSISRAKSRETKASSDLIARLKKERQNQLPKKDDLVAFEEQLVNPRTEEDLLTRLRKYPVKPAFAEKGVINLREKPVTVPKTEVAKIDNTSVVAGAEIAASGTNSLLLGVVINKREVGSLDVVRQGDTLLLPLLEFVKLAKFTVETTGNTSQLKTPLGTIKLTPDELQSINGITYISDKVLKEKLFTKIELNTFDFALIIDLPWGEGSEVRQSAVKLQPEFFPPSSGLSSYRQELNFTTGGGDSSFRASSLLGGRLGGGSWRVRLNNNFINSPNISEYFYYKKNGQFSYQVGQQQLGLHPLLSGITLTGAQFGFSNLPAERFNQTYNASELLPRRSRPIQTFQGAAPPASFVQLRVGGIAIAQQQVGLNGKYEFIDVNLPTGQSNEIELLVFDRNNPNVPTEIRSLRLNSSDLLLPSGGNVQLGGLGLTGNLAQDTLFNDFNSTEAGKFTAFYQLRQGLSKNLTFEGGVQTLPDTVQAQAGLVWRLANPLILSASVGTSRGEMGYIADLDFQLERLQIIGNTQLFPNGYSFIGQSRNRYNHSLEVKYKSADTLNLGFIARSRQDDSKSAAYILPTFSFRPMSGMYLSGRPDTEGGYLFNALYQINQASRLSFNTYNNRYFSDFSYNLNRQYQLSFGSEFGGDFSARYSATLNRNAFNLSGLSWRLGLAYSDGSVAPVAGVSMQVLPGLLARVDYQGIPSRSKNSFGGFGDDRFSISLVSDLSFAGGKISPASSTSLGKQRGAIAGRIIVEGNKGFDLGDSIIKVINNRGKNVSGAKTDARGNFFVGNLPEGIYTVELDPEKLPIELTVQKSILVAEVASAAVTSLDFTAAAEYGIAGRLTDAAGNPVANMRLDLINQEGKRVLAAWTDEFGLYRLDGVPVGNYTLLVPEQTAIAKSDTLPKIQVEVRHEFVYDQNLQLLSDRNASVP
jgi:Carboxypeptidase regulatory-like domain